MPNIKSVAKDVKRSHLRHLRNQATKSQIKTLNKKARTVIADANATPEQLTAAVAASFASVDKAWKHGIVHKNAANRRKSRIAKRLNALSAA